MPLNKNHEFEELDGVKCGIVEKNASSERAAFLRELLEENGYKVVVVPSPPAKTVPTQKATEGEAESDIAVTSVEKVQTFTIGVTDYTFNSINAIFGRSLKTKSGAIVTLAYWNQQDSSSDDSIPYFDKEETWR